MTFPTQALYTRITITEVNMGENFVSGTDAFGKSYRMMVDFHGPIAIAPQVGELWLIERRGNDWSLDARLETGSEQTSLSALGAGDRRLEASNDLWLNGNDVQINGSRIMINGVELGTTAQLVRVQQAGTTIGVRRGINLIPGSNIILSVADNAAQDRVDISIAGPQGVPTGTVSQYAGTAQPSGWEWADGGTLDAVANPTYLPLFNAIGTVHGGTGSNNFKKPDLQGRMVVGKGTHVDVSTLGATEGAALASRTMKHFHAKGTLAVGASGAHGHTFTGSAVTSGAGTAHSHGVGTFAVSGTTGTEAAHTHSPGTLTVASHNHGGGDHFHGWSNGWAPIGYYTTGSDTNTTNTTDGSGQDRHLDTQSLNSSGVMIGFQAPAVNAGATSAGTAHSHSFSANTTGTSATEAAHTHSVTAAGTLSATDTHSHTNADFSGNVGTTTGIAETPAYIVLNYIIKL